MTAENVHRPKWFVLVDDRIIPMPRQTVHAHLIKTEAGLDPSKVLLKDLESPHDIPEPDDALIDLALGNVFISRHGLKENQGTPSSARAKLAIEVDDVAEITLLKEQSREAIFELFDLPPNAKLFRDFEGPNDEEIGPKTPVVFAQGPCFYTELVDEKVTIHINDKPYEVVRGPHSVASLKKLGKVPEEDELVQIVVVDGKKKKVDLQDSGTVEICGGEVFISHPRKGTSS